MPGPARTGRAARGRHGLWAILAVLYGALIFALSAMPDTAIGALGLPAWLANLAHFPIYAGFGGFVLMAIAGSLEAVAAGPWPALWTFGAVCAYAVTDEYHQSFVPGRSPALGDLALDAAGAACAILIMSALSRRLPSKRALPPAGPAGFIRSDLLMSLSAGLLALVLYIPSLGNGFIPIWDDDDYVIRNASVHGITWPSVKSWWTVPVHGNYAPLALASLALDYTLWDLDPFGYHLQNALLHALASALLVWLLMSLRGPPLAAGVAGALYLVHPAQVEAVAWISERKSLLATVFLLLSFIVYARATRPSPGSRKGLLLSFLLFVGALLSKLSAVVLPGILLLYDLGYRRAPLGRILREKIPFVGAAVFFALLNAGYQAELSVLETEWMGGTLPLHFASIAALLARYARLLLFPTSLSALYDPPVATSPGDPWVVAGFLFLALGAAAALRAMIGARRSLWWIGAFWLGFLPVVQLVPFWIRMADRYLQIPLIGFAAGAGMGAAALFARFRAPARRAALCLLLAIVFGALVSLTLARQRVWHNPIALWRDALARPPVHYRSYLNYANALVAGGSTRDALPYYARALAGDPDFILTLVPFGLSCAEVGELGQARALLERAATFEGERVKQRVRAALTLGLIFRELDQPEEALKRFHLALSLDRESAAANAGVAQTLRALGRGREARRRLARVIPRLSGDPQIEIALAGLDADEGRVREARARLDRAIEAGGAHLAEALAERSRLSASLGDLPAARADLDRAIRETPPGLAKRRLMRTREVLERGGKPPLHPPIKPLALLIR